MDAGRNAAVETTSRADWARRALRQQLDTLSRLAAVARRLFDPAPPAQSAATVWAGVLNLEKALRLQTRVTWALRLIGALRARLHAELEAIDNGQAPAPPVAPPDLAAESDPAETLNPKEGSDRPERENLYDYERFGFEARGSDKKLAEILKRPTEEIIALICRELGLPEDWPRLAEEAWAREQDGRDWAEPSRSLATRPPPSPSRIAAAPS